MARKRETLDDLFLAKMAPDDTWEAFAERAGVASRTLWRMRKGIGTRTNRGTVALVAKELGVEPSRVCAAAEASRADASVTP